MVTAPGNNLRRERIFNDLVKTLSLTLDFDEGEKLHHAFRVGYMAYRMHPWLEGTDESTLFHGGLLHDIGGIDFSNHILHYMSGRTLVKEIWEHGKAGGRILKPLKIFSGITEVIEKHHEQYDGKGHPEKLDKSDIPLESSAILLADLMDLHLRRYNNIDIKGFIEGLSGKEIFPEVAQSALELINSDPDFIKVWTDFELLSSRISQVSVIPRNLHKFTELQILTQILWVLSRIIDAKHSYTMGHSIRTTWYAWKLSVELGSAVNKWDILWAGLLHDVGKVGVPRHILNKNGPLNGEEAEIIRKHASDTMAIISSITDLRHLAYASAAHHEFYNGKGYPLGRKGEDIPLIGRILALADSYDAMTTNRSYRSSLGKTEALRRLEAGRGKQFDPYLTDIAINVFREMGKSDIDVSSFDEFCSWFDSDDADISLLLQGAPVKASFVPVKDGALLIDSEPWVRVETDKSLNITHSEASEFPLNTSLLDNIAPDFYNMINTGVRGLNNGYILTATNKPVEFTLIQFPEKILFLYRSASNPLQNLDHLSFFYRNFLNSSEAVIFTDTFGVIKDANRAFLNLFGYRLIEITGKKPSIFSGDHESGKLHRAIWSTLKNADYGFWSGEVTDKRKDGTEIIIQLTISSVNDATGKLLGYMGQFLDITEKTYFRRELERKTAQLAANNIHLQELNRLKSDMVAITSHDLKSPVNSIISVASLLESRLKEGRLSEIETLVSRIKNLGHRSISFISMMLNLERLESGTFELNTSPVLLSSVLESALFSVSDQATSRGITIELEMDTDLLLEIDNEKIGQALVNIITNSLRYTPPDCSVFIKTGISDNCLFISIKDQGPGISSDKLELVFEKYFQDSQSGKTGSSGLGLYISKEFTKAHGGSIFCENYPEGGAVFTIILPESRIINCQNAVFVCGSDPGKTAISMLLKQRETPFFAFDRLPQGIYPSLLFLQSESLNMAKYYNSKHTYCVKIIRNGDINDSDIFFHEILTLPVTGTELGMTLSNWKKYKNSTQKLNS
ncbi:HD domain-containing protein [Myxococcota bacterium]|nr:HD domain-containing protein [Myxococcota bacterium]MBU1380844.1 HD domain-containing protein [Myxococcota bacterium]MBU1499141.1 HD domain-containing protein [Myxococcota bacterium]